MADESAEKLGPLARMAGTWEGVSGDDTAPSDDRGTEQNKYRERMVLEPTGPAQNHEQSLYGLRYHTQAWRIGETDPFHDEVGYWLWDAAAGRVMKCVTIPRGLTLLAGGPAQPGSRSFHLASELGSRTFGVCSNPFLDGEFQTVGFELEMTFHDDGSFSYEQVTRIRIKGREKPFEHRDKNTLKKVGA